MSVIVLITVSKIVDSMPPTVTKKQQYSHFHEIGYLLICSNSELILRQ